MGDAEFAADIARRRERWQAQAEKARALERQLKAWGVEVYQLAPAARPFGQRGKYPKPPYRKDENGQHLCRWCDHPLKSKNRWWCSRECVHAFQVRGDWNVIRRVITKRDKVCRLCGGGRFDVTEAGSCYDRDSWDRTDPRPWWPQSCPLKITWAVDHIVAVKDGGTDHPDNLRLLCGRCHLEVTAAQHIRWAAERRVARDGPAPEVLDLFASP